MVREHTLLSILGNVLKFVFVTQHLVNFSGYCIYTWKEHILCCHLFHCFIYASWIKFVNLVVYIFSILVCLFDVAEEAMLNPAIIFIDQFNSILRFIPSARMWKCKKMCDLDSVKYGKISHIWIYEYCVDFTPSRITNEWHSGQGLEWRGARMPRVDLVFWRGDRGMGWDTTEWNFKFPLTTLWAKGNPNQLINCFPNCGSHP